MKIFNKIFSTVLLLLFTLTLIDSASIWYTGENRPYEFGYTIQGNQHRHESKDIQGRINGEFGFITADNVYHVTVYATDENGNFKIISMKNIQLHQLPQQSLIPPTTARPPPTPPPPSHDSSNTQKSEPCASCHLLPPPPKQDTETVKPSVIPNEDSSTIPTPFKIVSKNDTPVNQKNVNQQDVENSLSNQANKNNGQANNDQQQNLNPNSRQPTMNEKLNTIDFSNNKLSQGGQKNQQQSSNGLLYRFDYATDFQGHKEEGDQLGNKNGEYFSIGRDNVKRIVTYNANEFGYMPYIRQQPISQHQDEQNNQLRHYNFEWFYPNSILYG